MQLKSVRLASRVETGPTTSRSWDDLDYDVLVHIMKRVSWHRRLFVACLVSKSWFSAVLDSLSPSGVINLKLMDTPKFQKEINRRYLSFLKRMLDSKPADSCSALYIGQTLLKSRKYVYIAKRTPSLERLVISRALGHTHSCFMEAMNYWRKLKYVQCPVYLFRFCTARFRKVESLRLFGVVDDVVAIAIRDRCPRLKRLYLVSCALSINALPTILDGHKKLELLDTRHSFCVRDCSKTAHTGKSKSVEWNEEEIRRKATGIKVHLRCTEQGCPECSLSWKCCFPKVKGPLKKNYPWDYLM